jgi:hypothetical protein
MSLWTVRLRASTASWPRYPSEDTGQTSTANLRAGYAAGAFPVREPGRLLRIEKLAMESPRQDEVLARLVAIAQRSRQVKVAELLLLVRQQ